MGKPNYKRLYWDIREWADNYYVDLKIDVKRSRTWKKNLEYLLKTLELYLKEK